MSNEWLRDLYAHQAWADAELWQRDRRASCRKRGRGYSPSAAHIALCAARVSVDRRAPRPSIRGDEARRFHLVRRLRDYAREYHDQAPFLRDLSDARLAEPVSIVWFKDPPLTITVAEALTQCAMHSQYHRGQNATRLRELGGEPPTTDLIYWQWKGRPPGRGDVDDRRAAESRSPTAALLLGLIVTLAAVVAYSWYITRQISGLRELQTDLVDRNRKDSLQLLRIQNDLNPLALAMRDMLDSDEPYPLTAWSAQFQRIRSDLEDALQQEQEVAVAHRTPEQRKYLENSVTQFWDAADRMFALARRGKEDDARAQIRLSLQARQAALSTSVARLAREQ